MERKFNLSVALSYLTEIYILFFLCIYVIPLKKFYFDILQFKFALFFKFAFSFFLLTLALSLIYFILHKFCPGKVYRFKFSVKFTPYDWAFIFFMLMMSLSTLLAPYKYEAFWGNRGRYMGLLSWLFIFFIYISVRLFYHYEKWHLYAFLISGLFPEILGFFNFFLLDPIGVYRNAPSHTVYQYISTIGNINTYTAYIALLLGLAGALYIYEEKENLRIMDLFLFFISSLSIITAKSDNAVLSAGMFFFLFPFFIKESEKLKRYLQILGVFLLAMVLASFIANSGIPNICFYDGLNDSGVLLKIGGRKELLYLSLILIAVSFVPLKINYSYFHRGYNILSLIALALFIFIFIDANTGGHKDIYNEFSNILIFDDDWGTERGYNWKFAFNYYLKNYDFLKKLFGNGPDTYFIVTTDNIFNELVENGSKLIDQAHNHYLGFLMNNGLLGLMGYMAFCFLSLKKMKGMPIFFPITAYLSQAFVNILSPLSFVPFITLFFIGIKASEDS